MEVMTAVVAWVVVTTGAVIFAFARMRAGLHDMMGMKIAEADADAFYVKQQAKAHQIQILDRYGITLTVVSAVLALVVLVLWALESAGGR